MSRIPGAGTPTGSSGADTSTGAPAVADPAISTGAPAVADPAISADYEEFLSLALQTRLFFIKSEACTAAFTCFSETHLRLSTEFEGSRRFICLSDTINEERCKELFRASTKQFKDALRLPWIFSKDESEEDVVVDVANTLRPLCREILVENNKKLLEKGLETASIGMGNRYTWHGSPDLRLRALQHGVDVVIKEEEEEEEAEDENEEKEELDTSVSSVGDGVPVEAKVNMLKSEAKVNSQVVATAVVASFTTHSRHPMITMSPILVLCKRRVRVCLYDCVQDHLLYSNSIPLLVSQKEGMAAAGMALIWIVLHFRELYTPVTYEDDWKSTIQYMLSTVNALEHFKKLRDNNVDFTSNKRKRARGFETDCEPETRVLTKKANHSDTNM